MGYPNPDILVSPQWLDEHKDDGDLVIVDCPWNYYSYTRAHIPSARCRPGAPHIKALDAEGAETVLVVSESGCQKLLGDLGIGADSTVVAYDDWGSIFATRLWWVLRYYGFNNVKVLDGGWQNWAASGYPVSFATQKIKEIEKPFDLRVNPEVLITIDELLDSYDDPASQVLDVRSDDEYHGRAAHGNVRMGRVPGALHLEWNQLLLNSKDAQGVRTFKPAGEIEALLEGAGVDGSKPIVTHCQAAVRATFTAFALELLGRNPVRVYDGSMAEWANREDTPLE